MKPVEIEFLMKDNLTGGLDKAGLAVDILQQKAVKAAEDIGRKITDQKGVIRGIETDLRRMESALTGMKPGTAQKELALDVAACRKVLDEERSSLEALEKEHAAAEASVRKLKQEYDALSSSQSSAGSTAAGLKERLREQKAVVKQIESDVKALEKAYRSAAPGGPKIEAAKDLNASRKALEEEKAILSELQREYDRTKGGAKRLTMQLREMQDAMARMRLSGQQNTEEYRKMAAEAANLSDTLQDLNTQTRILSNDDANLQGFMSGMSGLAGILTTATGALSLFATENENLQKIQTRLQSVMAVTMGLQQVFNTLNKDSAFRLVTVVRMKNLLTTATTRLSAALGISNVAAKALMGTLTLGLSVAVSGLIYLWDRYSSAQEKAAEKLRERVEIEKDGRAEMIKSRFEIESTLKKLKEFTGTKEEEKAKVAELNQKYGESFGYYTTLSEWYDVLQEKGEKYIEMLFLQAKVQSLVNKAAEADEEVNRLKAMKPEDVEGSHGGVYRFFAKLGAVNTGMTPAEMDRLIDEENLKNQAAKVNAVKAKVDEYLAEARKAQEEYNVIGRENSIGGHVKPEDKTKEAEKELQAEKLRWEKLRSIQAENRASELALQKESAEKKRKEVLLQYDNEIDAVKRKEKELLSLYDREGTAGKMLKAFGGGNVDVLARPLVDAARLVEKGWEDAGEGIATVFSSSYGVEDAGGSSHEILVTPILPDGTVLSPGELEEYIDTVLNGAEDILSADKKGLVIKVDAESGEGETLHKLQEKFYDVPEKVQKELVALYQNAADSRDKALENITLDEFRTERDALNDYLKEYGTYQERRLAIATEYAEKIQKAEEVGRPNEVKRLEKEQSVKVASLEAEAIRQDIDWTTVFGGFGGMFRDVIRDTLEKAEKYTRTADFKNADAKDQEAVTGAIMQMKKTLGSGGSLDFKKLGRDVDAYRQSMREVEEAREVERVALENLRQAQKAYEEALRSGTEEERTAAETALETAQMNAEMASSSVRAGETKVKESQRVVSETATNLSASMQDVTEGLQKLSSGGLKSAYDGLIQAGQGLGGTFGELADSLESVPVIGWILSIIDILKDGLSNLMGSLIDSVLGAVGGIISDVLSGSLVKTVFSSVVSGVGGVLDALTFGLFSSHGNADEVNRLVERLTESNRYLVTAIEKLTQRMEESGGAESTAYYNDVYQKQKEKIENDRQMLEAKMGYWSAHHSNNYYIDKAFSRNDWQKASDYIGKDLNTVSDLWRLSPEDLARFQELPDIWEKINSGKYDQGEYLDEYISDANTLIDLQEQWQDAITDTSFDSIKSGMKELLKDFETDSKDVIASVDEFMQNAILKSIVDGTYSEELKKWQELFAEFMSDGILSREEADELRGRYEEIFREAAEKKDAMFGAAGIEENKGGVTQSGKAGGFTTMTQDQGTKLEGLFVSGAMHWSSIDSGVEDISGKMDKAEGHLAKIEEYTGVIRDTILKILESCNKAHRDGLRVRN
ncbi:hypothetical protein [Parabacteroides goldsteinii]|uniref:hypothetical protein n=1 Tax=Parabacteroides goldsteinii TaxID=328812 RepID=UPI0026772BE4|nr:hypothetical protein [Parabacteroides goldsteinii]